MSSLYEINEQLLALTDPETGEVIDVEKFDSLQMDYQIKIENIALWYKNLLSDADQFAKEKDVFADREKRAKNKAESLKRYLDNSLHGTKFSTPTVAISYRKSATVEWDGVTKLPDEYLLVQEPKIDKANIKKAINEGKVIDGCRIEEHQNIQIK